MKFSPMVRTREVELEFSAVLFVMDMPPLLLLSSPDCEDGKDRTEDDDEMGAILIQFLRSKVWKGKRERDRKGGCYYNVQQRTTFVCLQPSRFTVHAANDDIRVVDLDKVAQDISKCLWEIRETRELCLFG